MVNPARRLLAVLAVRTAGEHKGRKEWPPRDDHHRSTRTTRPIRRPRRQFRMGYRLAFTRKPASFREAARWWRLSAAQGHARAQFYLGTCFDFGHGTRKDRMRAFELYLMAARGGHDVAQYNVALCYRDGQGLKRDARKAARWFAKAAALGLKDAQRDLGFCLHEGLGIRRDFAAAAHWYRKAAHQGDGKAQVNLALCYLEGEGVRRSRAMALRWLREAAAQKHRRTSALLDELVY